jgi:hypothetical protein
MEVKMKRCEAIKPSGDRCKARAMRDSQWCYNHDPEHAAARSVSAGKAGSTPHKRKHISTGTRELPSIKRRLIEIAEGAINGEVDKSRAAVAGQVYNCVLRAIEIERKIKESEELEARIAELEAREHRGRSWGV